MKILTTLVLLNVLLPMALALSSPAPSAPLKVGEMAPDFVLASDSGQKVTLSAAQGKSPVVLVFYRGYW